MSRKDPSVELAATLKLARQIDEKVRMACEPLEREMKIMQWPAEFRVILWEILAAHAETLAAEARRS